MLLLTSTSDLLRITTSAAVATHVQASWVDNASGTITPGRTNTIISTATTTTVVASPAASTQRNVKHLSVLAVGGAQTVTVIHTDGTTAVDVFSAPLAVGEMLLFTDGNGFEVLDANGARKTVPSNVSGTNTGDVTIGAPAAVTANGLSISGQVLSATPADATHPGDVTTSAQSVAGLKTFVNDAALGTGAVSGASSTLKTTYARYNTATAQALTSGSFNIINFDTAVVDTDSAVTTGASWHFTVPAGKAGLYELIANVNLVLPGSAVTEVVFSFFINGAETFRCVDVFTDTAATRVTGHSAITVNLAAGATVDFRVNQQSGTNKSLNPAVSNNFISITRVPGS